MTGIELIAKERQEQIEKHKWDLTLKNDYGNEELLRAAEFAIDQDWGEWPRHWTSYFKEKIKNKTRVEQLAVAGAFIAAEIDRLLHEDL